MDISFAIGGIGNTIFSEAFPDAGDETTPWQYP